MVFTGFESDTVSLLLSILEKRLAQYTSYSAIPYAGSVGYKEMFSHEKPFAEDYVMAANPPQAK